MPLKIMSELNGLLCTYRTGLGFNQLINYSWPRSGGKFRNVIERAVILEKKGVITDGQVIRYGLEF